MTPSILIAQMMARGVRLTARAGTLIVDAPRGVLTAIDIEALREGKAGVIASLTYGSKVPTSPPRLGVDHQTTLGAPGRRSSVEGTGSGLPRPNWENLASCRWGPALDDPTPGIVMDEPSPTRLFLALRELANHPDTEAASERLAIRAEASSYLIYFEVLAIMYAWEHQSR